MTQEDKDLLFRDLCARLPYGVKVYNEVYRWTAYPKGVVGDRCYFNDNPRYDGDCTVEEVKPYLRPISSITEEEVFDYVANTKEIGCISALPIQPRAKSTDWLNEHHFDYRGLIPMGLALEAPEDMYKTESL